MFLWSLWAAENDTCLKGFKGFCRILVQHVRDQRRFWLVIWSGETGLDNKVAGWSQGAKTDWLNGDLNLARMVSEVMLDSTRVLSPVNWCWFSATHPKLLPTISISNLQVICLITDSLILWSCCRFSWKTTAAIRRVRLFQDNLIYYKLLPESLTAITRKYTVDQLWPLTGHTGKKSKSDEQKWSHRTI